MNARLILCTIALLLIANLLPSQSNTMYYQPLIPQAYYLNPASQPRANFFLALPITYYFENENTSLHLSDMIWNDPTTGQVLHPFHPNANLDEFFDQFGDENRLAIKLDYTPLSFGFRVREMYFTFDLTSKTDASYSYPRAFMELAFRGNADNTTYDFSSLGIHFSEHLEFALGISRKFGDMLTIGIRPKLLTGVALVSSSSNEITLTTTHEEWVLNSQINLQLSTPGMTIPIDEEGHFDPQGEFVFDSTLSGTDYKNLLLANKGFGIDLGAHFRPIPRLTVSASVIDIGFINWEKYIHTASLSGSYSYEGINYQNNEDNVNDTTGFLETVWDSVKSNFEVTGSDAPFKTNLEPKIFIGGNFALTKKIDAGLLARFDMKDDGMKTRVVFHANWHPSSFYALTISYCPIGEQARTFGTGVSGRIGPFSYYTVFDYRVLRYNLYKYDNIPFLILPADRSLFNVRFGMNIVIGTNHKKKLKRDKPMYYTGE